MLVNGVIELIKYGFFGVLTTAFNFALFYAMIKIGINYIVSNVVSYFFAVMFSYILNNRYVFENSKSQKGLKKFVKFLVVRLFVVCVDTGLLYLLVYILELDVFYSKIFLSITIIMTTYVVNKLFVFGAVSDRKK